MASTRYTAGTVYTSAWGNDVDKVAYQRLNTVAGTDIITAVGSAALTAYTDVSIEWIASGTNTGPVTIDLTPFGYSALGAVALTKYGSTALAAGDLVSGQAYRAIFDGTRFQLLGSGGGAGGTQTVPTGGTGVTTTTPYSPVFTGTTATDNFKVDLGPGTSGQILTSAGAGAYPTWVTPTVSTNIPVPVRQTVLSGPVDTSGLPSFGGSTGSTTVTASGTLIATAANGFTSSGQIDRVGSITNPAWTGLSTNGTMYLFLDIASNGTCTTGSGTLLPTYRWGGADVVTTNQFTFNIQEMIGKVGNGATAAQTYRVYVGEVTVAGGVVTAITWYALQGRYDSGRFAVAVSTNYSKNHNIGAEPRDVIALGAVSGGALQPVTIVFTSAYNGAALYGITRLAAAVRTQPTLSSPGATDGLPTTINEIVIRVLRGW